MRIAVVIPTYKRIKKLERCLDSVQKQTYRDFDVYIYCDNNDYETFEYFSNQSQTTWRKYSCIKMIGTNGKQEFVIGTWNNFFTNYYNRYDAVAWIVDDVELYPNYLRELANCMHQNFPDLDGVIGAKQECPNHPEYTFKWYGQCLIGRKFIERYKDVDYKVCCPDYSHFYQDEEMWMFANELGKFKNCETAVLKHYHPAFVKEEVDDTHPLVRGRVKRVDDGTYAMRRKQGLVWGKSWELVNK